MATSTMIGMAETDAERREQLRHDPEAAREEARRRAHDDAGTRPIEGVGARDLGASRISVKLPWNCPRSARRRRAARRA